EPELLADLRDQRVEHLPVHRVEQVRQAQGGEAEHDHRRPGGRGLLREHALAPRISCRRSWVLALRKSVYVYGLSRILVSGMSGFMPFSQASSPSWARRCSTVRSTACRAAARSTPTSSWSRFTTRPFTSTVWTSPRWAWNTTWPC